MPKNSVKILVSAEDKASQVLNDVKKNSKDLSNNFSKSATEINQSLELMKKGLFAVQKAFEFVERGAKFDQQRESFKNIAKQAGVSSDEVIKSMREMAGETVSASDAMAGATRAMVLGLAPEKLPKLMEIARASARAFGTDTKFMFDSLSLGIGRQSRMLLDNLGIIVDAESAYKTYADSLGITADKLTDAQKKEAFLNAALEAGQKQIDAMDLSTRTNAESIEKLKGLWKDFVDGLASAVSNLVAVKFAIEQVTSALEFYSDALKGIDKVDEAMNKTFKSSLPALTNVQKELVKVQEERDKLQQRVDSGGLGGEVVFQRIKDLTIQEERLMQTIVRLRGQAAEIEINKQKEAPKEKTAEDVFKATLDERTSALEEFQQKLNEMNDEQIAAEVTKLENEELLTKTLEENKTDIIQKEVDKRKNFAKKEAEYKQLMHKRVLDTAISVLTLLGEKNKGFAIAAKALSFTKAVISAHEGAAKALALTANPVLAKLVWTLGMVEAGAIAATPLAEGGIVTKPTYSLIGEAGPEAVIPLKDDKARNFGNTTVNIVIERADLSSSQNIFDTAEMLGREFETAIRTGRSV